jgi:hypothetical protein
LIELFSAGKFLVGDKVLGKVKRGENCGLPSLLLTNDVPHFVNGISGRNFQSPFASPPGVVESSSLVNVIWGMANFILGYILVAGVGDYAGGLTLDALMVGSGSVLMALSLAWHFGRVRMG